MKYSDIAELLQFCFLLDNTEKTRLTKLKNAVMAKANIQEKSEHLAKNDKPRQSSVDTAKMVKALFAN